ncbi:MAG: lytic transglycosylase domain-containing protein [Gammaproteobacteria bacterium]
MALTSIKGTNTRRRRTALRRNLGVAVFALLGVCLAGPAGAGEVYLYALPDGSRMLTDHAIHEPGYTLLRASGTLKGMGRLAAGGTPRGGLNRHRLDRMIADIARRNGVDVFFLIMMQLMPDTARRFGVDDLYDPRANVEAGVRYLKYLLKKYRHHPQNALAAYNAGEDAVATYDGIPPYRETMEYVRKVLHYRDLYAAQ